MQPISILRFAASIGLWLFITTISSAAPTDNTEKITDLQRDVAVIKETTTLRLEAQKDALQKDLQNLQSKIDQQDKRIGDISAETGRLSVVAGLLSVFITLIVAVFGFLSWANAGTKAREVAKDWIEKHGGELMKATEIEKEKVEATAKAVTKRMNDSAMEVDNAKKEIQASLSAGKLPSMSVEQKDALHAEESRLKEIPESQYAFGDWMSRAFTSLAESKIDLAVNYFSRASTMESATSAQVAEALFNSGIAYGQLDRYDEANNAYDQIIAKFGEATELSLHGLVGKAMINKGVNLFRLGRTEDAIKVYDQIIESLATASDFVLRDHLASAMVNKGNMLVELKRFDDAIKIYDSLLEHFVGANEPALLVTVAGTMVNKGNTLRKLNRSKEAIDTYDQVITRFSDATEIGLQVQALKAVIGKDLC